VRIGDAREAYDVARPGVDRFDTVGIVVRPADGRYRWVGDATDAEREQGRA